MARLNLLKSRQPGISRAGRRGIPLKVPFVMFGAVVVMMFSCFAGLGILANRADKNDYDETGRTVRATIDEKNTVPYTTGMSDSMVSTVNHHTVIATQGGEFGEEISHHFNNGVTNNEGKGDPDKLQGWLREGCTYDFNVYDAGLNEVGVSGDIVNITCAEHVPTDACPSVPRMANQKACAPLPRG